MSRPFVFLVATERSGSNFITSLLNGHPAVSGPPPSHLFRLFITNRGNYGDLEADRNWSSLVSDFVFAQTRTLGQWNTCPDEAELAAVSPRSVGSLLRFAYEKEAAGDGAEMVFVKENQTPRFADVLERDFHGCRYVFLFRDPRDVASSWVDAASLDGGVEHATAIWIRDQEASLRFYDQIRPSGRGFPVSYEKLVTDTVGTLKALCDFLGVAYDSMMLKFHDQPRTAQNADRIAAWRNLKQPVMKGNTGKYRENLSRADIEYIESICYREMDRLGYDLDFPRPTEYPGSDRTRARRLEQLRPRLTVGKYEGPGVEERALRRARLEAIDRVLSRRPGS